METNRAEKKIHESYVSRVPRLTDCVGCPGIPRGGRPALPSILLPSGYPLPHALAMFCVSESDAAAIREAFEQGGVLAAAVELRRRFPGVDNANAVACARSVAAWESMPSDALSAAGPETVSADPANERRTNRND